MIVRRSIRIVLVFCAFAVALAGAFAYATAPPTLPAETVLPTVTFDATTSPVTVQANNLGGASTAWWGRATSQKHAGAGALWCAGTRPTGPALTVGTYPLGSRGTATLLVPGLGNFYSSKLSFWYAMPSLGAADKFGLYWARTGIPVNQGDLETPTTTVWTAAPWRLRTYNLSSVSNKVSLSRYAGTFYWDFTDAAEGPFQSPIVGTGPVIDDVQITGYTYGPVRSLSASPAMSPGYTVTVTWSRPASTTTDPGDDTRSKSYQIWREDIASGALVQLLRFDEANATPNYVDTTLSIDRAYRYYVQAFEPGSGTTHRGEMATPLVVTKQTTPTSRVIKSPPVANGTNGWYRTRPSVSLNRDVTGSRTYYHWDAGLDVLYDPNQALSVPEGDHTLYFHSVSPFGLVESEKSESFLVDIAPPTSPVLVDASILSPSQVRLEWTASSDGEGSQIAGYRVYRDGLLVKDIEPALIYEIANLPPNSGHYLYVTAYDSAGNESGYLSTWVWMPPAWPTQVSATIGGSTPRIVSVGSTGIGGGTSISAILSADSGGGQMPLGGRALAIYSSTSGPSGPWSKTSYAASPTSVPGRYSALVRTTTKTWYQVRFLASGPYGGSTSATTMFVQVRPYLTKPTVPTTAYRTRTATLTGKMYPKHVGTTRVYFERWEAYKGKYMWRKKLYKTASLRAGSTYEKYSVALKFPSVGRWRARAWHGDFSHYPTYGSYSSIVTVR